MATVSFSITGAASVELPLRQFDADEYIAMAEVGVFEQRRRVELIGGYIVDMSPAGSHHNYVIIRLPKIFSSLMAKFELCIQGTLKIDRRHVFDPDFMLLTPRARNYYKDNLPTSADVALLVEISASSLGRDADVKRPIYAAASVPEYWIADVDREVLIVHRAPKNGVYQDVQELASDTVISPLAAPEMDVRIAAIFSEDA
jgi:Uma2 family endonuclease